MRASEPYEQACEHDDSCWGKRLPFGHVLPAFMPMSPQCIICLRASVLKRWLLCLSDGAPEIIQPYACIIGPNEYSEEACFVPFTKRFDGIVRPYVRFAIDRLEWDGTVLRQTDVVEYKLVPSIRHEPRPPHLVFMQNGTEDLTMRVIRDMGLFTLAPETKLHDELWDTLWGGPLNSPRILQWLRDCLDPVVVNALEERHFNWHRFTQTGLRRKHLRLHGQENFKARLSRLGGLEPTSELWDLHWNKDATDKMMRLRGKSREVRPADAPRFFRVAQFMPGPKSYACLHCKTFKGFMGPAEKPRYGQHHLAYDLLSEEIVCFRKQNGGRKRKRHEECPLEDLITCRIQGCVVELFGEHVLLTCDGCGCFFERQGLSLFCQSCLDNEAITKRLAAECAICMTKKSLRKRVLVFEDVREGSSPWTFCEAHAFKFLDLRKIWARPLLMAELKRAMERNVNKKYTAQVRRI
jgi:hypothetical protein